MAGRIRGWLMLTGSQRVGLVAIMFALIPIAAALRLFGYRRTRRWLERHAPNAGSRCASPDDLAAAQGLARLASIAGRHSLIEVTCLRQSLLVFWLLRRRGLNAEIKLGVRKQDGTLDAHAWVELDGLALAQPDLAHHPFDVRQGSA